jgi:hypothetical protein
MSVVCARRGADDRVEPPDVLAYPAPCRRRVTAASSFQGALPIGHALGPGRLRLPEDHQLPLRCGHLLSLPANRFRRAAALTTCRPALSRASLRELAEELAYPRRYARTVTYVEVGERLSTAAEN